MPQTFWVKVAEPSTLANGPSGLSHYDPRAHENTLDDWVGKPVDINHFSVRLPDSPEGDSVGTVVDARFVGGEGLFHKIEVEDRAAEIISNDQHTGFSIGTQAIHRDGATIIEYIPNHLAMTVFPSEPMCDKDKCDVIESVSETFLMSQTYKQPLDADDMDLSSFDLSEEIELEVLRLLTENKRFNKGSVMDAIETATGMVSESSDTEPGPGKRTRQKVEPLESQEFDSFEQCVVQFKEGGRSKEQAISACQRIFQGDEAAKHGDCPPGKVMKDGECVEASSKGNENVQVDKPNGEIIMSGSEKDCNCGSSEGPSADEFQALSSRLDELENKLEQKTVELASKSERVEELENQLSSKTERLTEYEDKEKERLIQELPESQDIDYESKSVERLRELHQFHLSTKVETAGADPAGAESEVENEERVSDFRSALRKVNGE